MSIEDEIKKHLGSGIFVLPPLLPSQKAKRTMFVSKEINDVASPSSWGRGFKGKRLAEMRASLDRFTSGERIPVAENPRKKSKTAFLARVEPLSAVSWDIRCIEPSPGIRVFCRFAKKDFLVALTWEYREALRGHGGFDSAVDRSIRTWQQLFPNCPPHQGENLNDYLSNFYPV